jgi:hypothetical protein
VEKTIAPLFKGALYSSEGSDADRPPIGLCIESLLGSKYERTSTVVLGEDYSPLLNSLNRSFLGSGNSVGDTSLC